MLEVLKYYQRFGIEREIIVGLQNEKEQMMSL
jgi:hypothetical protein